MPLPTLALCHQLPEAVTVLGEMKEIVTHLLKGILQKTMWIKDRGESILLASLPQNSTQEWLGYKTLCVSTWWHLL